MCAMPSGQGIGLQPPQPQQPIFSSGVAVAATGDLSASVAATSPPPQQQQQQQQQSLEHARMHRHGAFRRPCAALSWNIMQLYRLINSKYSEERRRRQPGPRYNDGYDDKHGHYLVFTGEEIWGRYTVQGVFGRGSFGTVLKCFDEKHQEQVAVKVIRNGEYFYDQGLIEVDIVARLNSIPSLENLVVRLGKVFVWKSHLVLVFEMLSMNLFQLIQRTNYNGVSLDLTRKFAYQLVLVLKQLEEHRPPIIHCDVKPENVVLRDPSRSSIRLIDFGSACFLKQGAKLYKYVQSRFYRSVEVILELGYDTAIDRWSLGCMLVELHTGIPLFAGKNEVDQIARFTGVLGSLPDDMIERSHKKDLFFFDRRQSVQEPSVRDPMTLRSGGNNISSPAIMGNGQRRDPVGSPSPVIAAEVLHSLSAASSISVVTAGSVAAGPFATSSNAFASASVAVSPPAVALAPEAPEGHQPLRNPSAASNCNSKNSNNGSCAAVPALCRPVTAIALTSFSKKWGSSLQTGAIGGERGCITPVATGDRKCLTAGKKLRRKTHTDVVTATANVVPPVASAVTGIRPSSLAPKLRLTSSSNAITHGEGTMSLSLPPARGTGRTSSQQTDPQQHVSVPATKSPFVLRVQPMPEHCQSLEEIIGVYAGGPRGCRRGQPGHDVEDYKIFLDFIQRLLCYDPRKRMTCTEALQHPFLMELEMQKQWKHLAGGAPSEWKDERETHRGMNQWMGEGGK